VGQHRCPDGRRSDFGKLAAHPHGHCPAFLAELPLENRVVGGRDLVQVSGAASAVGVQERDAVRHGGPPGRGADELGQRGGFRHDALLNRCLERVRERERTYRQEGVTELE
jgi:hypothetical protein